MTSIWSICIHFIFNNQVLIREFIITIIKSEIPHMRSHFLCSGSWFPFWPLAILWYSDFNNSSCLISSTKTGLLVHYNMHILINVDLERCGIDIITFSLAFFEPESEFIVTFSKIHSKFINNYPFHCS